MPEDLAPNRDELASTTSTTSATGPGTTNEAVPAVPVRPPSEPRAYESLEDDDPRYAAGNEDDETQAS